MREKIVMSIFFGLFLLCFQNGAMYVDDERYTIEPLPAGMMVTEYNGTGEPHIVSHSNRDRANNTNTNANSDETHLENDRCFTERKFHLTPPSFLFAGLMASTIACFLVTTDNNLYI